MIVMTKEMYRHTPVSRHVHTITCGTPTPDQGGFDPEVSRSTCVGFRGSFLTAPARDPFFFYYVFYIQKNEFYQWFIDLSSSYNYINHIVLNNKYIFEYYTHITNHSMVHTTTLV